MTTVATSITTSVDGYIVGPNDGPEMGLGEGGARLHYWVFGGPWSYESGAKGEATGADKEFLDEAFARAGAVVGGRDLRGCRALGRQQSVRGAVLHRHSPTRGAGRRGLHVRRRHRGSDPEGHGS